MCFVPNIAPSKSEEECGGAAVRPLTLIRVKAVGHQQQVLISEILVSTGAHIAVGEEGYHLFS
jgi:hypothetical protein